MVTILRLVAIFATSIGLTAGARASVMNLSSGTLGIKVGALPTLAFSASNVPIAVSSGGASFTEPAGIFTGSVMLPTTLFTGVPLIDGLTIANLANGTKFVAQGAAASGQTTGIVRAGGGLGGPGSLEGTAIINVLGLFNLAIALSPVGNTGATTSVIGGSIIVTVLGTGWTTGPVTVTGITTATPVNTVTFAGYDNRTPGHAGVLLLISPFKVITNAAGNLPGLATQSLTFAFVPEPALLLFLGLGITGLALHAARRTRR